MREQSFCFCSKKKAVVRQIHSSSLVSHLSSSRLDITRILPPKPRRGLVAPKVARPAKQLASHSLKYPQRRTCQNQPYLSELHMRKPQNVRYCYADHRIDDGIYWTPRPTWVNPRRLRYGRGPGMEYELTGCSDQLPSQFHLI